MKKLLLLAPIAALALASCSNDEQIAQSPALNAQEVTFRPAVNGTTRTVTTDATLTEFQVEAAADGSYLFYEVAKTDPAPTAPFTNIPYTSSINAKVTKNAGKWELFGDSEKKYYWSSKNATASFTAYYPAEVKSKSQATASGIVIPNNIADQKDIIVAYNSGSASEFSNGVPLLFRHVLSQIVIKADNKDADIRQIKVAGVRLHNIANTNKLPVNVIDTKTTAEDFSWWSTENTAGYQPWTAAATNPFKYKYFKGSTEPTNGVVAAADCVTLNASAQEITFDGPALLFPQTGTAATTEELSTASMNTATLDANGKVYIDVLVQVQDLEVTIPATDGTADQNTAANTAVKERAIFPKITADNVYNLDNYTYAWVAVPVDIAWNPGYKYTYILHFSKDGIGKVSPDEEGGNPDPGPQPGEEIVDNPVPLYFTVTVDEWNDAAKTEKDL